MNLYVTSLSSGCKFDDLFKKLKFNVEDGARNGIMLPPNKELLDDFVKQMTKQGKSVDADEFIKRALHEGSHYKYTDRVREELSKLRKEVNKVSDFTEEIRTYYDSKLSDIITGFRSKLISDPNYLKN